MKRPKVYFLEDWLLYHVRGLDRAAASRLEQMAGLVMETLAVSRFLETISHRGLTQRLIGSGALPPAGTWRW